MYQGVPTVFEWLPSVDDQQLGGVIMKIVQEIVYGIALAHAFFTWYRLERKGDDDDIPLQAEDGSYGAAVGQLKQV